MHVCDWVDSNFDLLPNCLMNIGEGSRKTPAQDLKQKPMDQRRCLRPLFTRTYTRHHVRPTACGVSGEEHDALPLCDPREGQGIMSMRDTTQIMYI